MTRLQIIGVFLIVINICIICPLCVYYSFSYFKRSTRFPLKGRILRHRRIGTLQINLVVVCAFYLVEQTLSIVQAFTLVPEIPSMLTVCIALPTYALLFYTAMLRSFLLFYDQQTTPHMHAAHAVATTLCSKHDDCSNNNDNDDCCEPGVMCRFLVKHRNTLGNETYLYSFLAVLYIASVCIVLLSAYIVFNAMHESAEYRLFPSTHSALCYLAIIELVVIMSPAVAACALILVMHYCHSHSHAKNIALRHENYAQQFNVASSVLTQLDREIILVPIWTIIACSVRVVIAIAMNLIALQSSDTNVRAEYVFMLQLWDVPDSHHDSTNIAMQSSRVYVVLVPFVWSALSVFVLHWLQTRRTLNVLGDAYWKNTNCNDGTRESRSSLMAEDATTMDCAMAIIPVTGSNRKRASYDEEEEDEEEEDEYTSHAPVDCDVSEADVDIGLLYAGAADDTAVDHDLRSDTKTSKFSTRAVHHHHLHHEYEQIENKETDELDDDDNAPSEMMHLQSPMQHQQPAQHQHQPWTQRLFGVFGYGQSPSSTPKSPFADKTFARFPAALFAIGKAKSDNCHDVVIPPGTHALKPPQQQPLQSFCVKKVPLNRILAIKEGYDLFMAHLAKEYSTENLRFLVEVAQLKHRLVLDILHDCQWLYKLDILRSPFLRHSHCFANHARHAEDEEMKEEEEDPGDGADVQNVPPLHFHGSRSKSLARDPKAYATVLQKKPVWSSAKQLPTSTAALSTKSVKSDKNHKIAKMRKQFSNAFNVHSFAYTLSYGWFLALSDGIPLTEIITDDHWRSFYSKAKKLYTKYIEAGCDCEVNLSYNCRNVVTYYFNSEQHYQAQQQRKPSITRSSAFSSSGNGRRVSKSEQNIFEFETQSVVSVRSNHTLRSRQHSQDDLTRYRRGSASTHSIIDDSFCTLKKSRSFHNVFEADDIHLEVKEEEDSDEDEDEAATADIDHVSLVGVSDKPSSNRILAAGVQVHDLSATNVILDRLDDNACLLQIFDNAAEEIYSVLRRDSLSRFYASDEYVRTFLPKYGHIETHSKFSEMELEQQNRDVELALYYFCDAKKSMSSSSPPRAQRCHESHINRETLCSKLKRLKRSGIKRKKPAWIRPKTYAKKTTKKTPVRKLNIQVSHWHGYSKEHVDDKHESYGTLLSPLTISRRSIKSASASASPVCGARAKKKDRRKQKGLAIKRSDTANSCKLDPHENEEDNSVRLLQFDEEDSDNVPIVRIVNVNVNVNVKKPGVKRLKQQKYSKTTLDIEQQKQADRSDDADHERYVVSLSKKKKV